MASDQASRANWKDTGLVKLFLDLCLEEVSNKGKNGTSLRIESWTNIEKVLLEKKGFKVNQRQLKNQWDYLKKKYTVWSNLVNNATGHGLDPVTNTVNWSAERWEDYIKGNPDASKFCYTGLKYADEMKSLFDGITATGRAGWGPSKEGLPKDGVGSSLTSEVPIEISQTNIDSVLDSPSAESSKNDVPQPKPKRCKKSEASGLDDQLERVLNTLEKSDGPTLKECNAVLNAMEKLEMSNPLYVAALSIFCVDQSYRKQWIEISEMPEEVRIDWLQMNAKKLGYI